ncbi:hypothetical protein [Salininema proteolyticum]|uniref:Uncharacterized protein n=1 Tax=Salininema proteolyticum TaxID=1607685 RepID=A0ABV8TVH1_9ACTN
MKNWIKKTVVTGAMAVVASTGAVAGTSTAAHASVGDCTALISLDGWEVGDKVLNACRLGAGNGFGQIMCLAILADTPIPEDRAREACEAAQ